MDDLLAWLTTSIRDRWHARSGLLIALALVVAVLVYFFAAVKLSNVGLPAWVFIGLVAIGVTVWWWLTALPRVEKGKVGFAVAIDYEDAKHAPQIRSDFVATLRKLIDESASLKHQFQFIEYGDWISRQLKTTKDANRLVRRSRVHFLLWGTAKSRVLTGGRTHVIDLQGLVRHRAISSDAAKSLAEDFSAVLPRVGVVEQSNDLFAFEIAAQHLDAVARYVVATAAMFSRDYDYAEQLLIAASAWTQRYTGPGAVTPVSILADRTTKRLIDLYELQLAELVQRYTLRRSVEALKAAEEVIPKLRALHEDHYIATLAAATAAFVLRRDVAGALEEITRCQRVKDATWRYSLAFLVAYPGDLDAAYRQYQAAFRTPMPDQTVPIQSEEFIQLILEQEPQRYWLWFCLGIINHRAKQDLTAAKADFERFLAATPDDRYKTQRVAVEKWLGEIATDLETA